ncbi:MAG: aldehyde:ferredoxin oxidoreductase, partial [Deltaproteobacteria bacterium]|nr:aldehyde:ferredoxin oxidoreductase [Deltaproteobacteria bacterium]
KFFDITQGIGTQMVVDCLKSDFELEVDPNEIKAAVHRAFILGLALEFRQGYTKEEYSLPQEVFDNPNPNIKLPNITTPEFIAELEEKVWRVFDKELERITPGL